MAEKLRAVTSGSGNLIPRLDVVFGCQFALLIDSCLHTCSRDPVDGVKDDSKRQYPTLASIILPLGIQRRAGEEQKALLC